MADQTVEGAAAGPQASPVSIARLKSMVGVSSRVYEEVFTEAALTGFSRAIGAPPEAGLPPTFLTRMRAGEFELFGAAGLRLEQVLHAEQEYAWDEGFSPREGDILRSQAKYVDIKERAGKSGPMAFATVETEVALPSGAKALARTVIVVRGVVA